MKRERQKLKGKKEKAPIYMIMIIPNHSNKAKLPNIMVVYLPPTHLCPLFTFTHTTELILIVSIKLSITCLMLLNPLGFKMLSDKHFIVFFSIYHNYNLKAFILIDDLLFLFWNSLVHPYPHFPNTIQKSIFCCYFYEYNKIRLVFELSQYILEKCIIFSNMEAFL